MKNEMENFKIAQKYYYTSTFLCVHRVSLLTEESASQFKKLLQCISGKLSGFACFKYFDYKLNTL